MNIFDEAKDLAAKTETKVDDKAVSLARRIYNDTKFVIVHKTWGALAIAIAAFTLGLLV